MTSSPGPMPAARRRITRASVPLATATACRAPVRAAIAASSSAVTGPEVNRPEAATWRTMASSRVRSRRAEAAPLKNGMAVASLIAWPP